MCVIHICIVIMCWNSVFMTMCWNVFFYYFVLFVICATYVQRGICVLCLKCACYDYMFETCVHWWCVSNVRVVTNMCLKDVSITICQMSVIDDWWLCFTTCEDVMCWLSIKFDCLLQESITNKVVHFILFVFVIL